MNAPAFAPFSAEQFDTAHYVVEDLMKEAGIWLQPIREKNSKHPVPSYVAYLQLRGRKIVETTGSLIERLLPMSIHAATSHGFELKVMLFAPTRGGD